MAREVSPYINPTIITTKLLDFFIRPTQGLLNVPNSEKKIKKRSQEHIRERISLFDFKKLT